MDTTIQRWLNIDHLFRSIVACQRELLNIEIRRGVEKVHFPPNSGNLGDRKYLGKLRKSFVGHPDAILFLRISRERVFSTPTPGYVNYAHPVCIKPVFRPGRYTPGGKLLLSKLFAVH
jgi:hypothetical protein